MARPRPASEQPGPRRPSVPNSSNKLQGFSLLELLIALIVFSIGLLAIAGLQTVSKQSNYEAVQRTTAAQVANGLLEDMRSVP